MQNRVPSRLENEPPRLCGTTTSRSWAMEQRSSGGNTWNHFTVCPVCHLPSAIPSPPSACQRCELPHLRWSSPPCNIANRALNGSRDARNTVDRLTTACQR